MSGFEKFGRELRYALGSLLKAPVLSGAAVLTLALAIGGNRAVFSVLHGVVLRPPPYGDPDRLVMVWSRWTDFEKTWLSAAELIDYRTSVASPQDVAAWSTGQGNLTGRGEPVQIGVGAVTANILTVLHC